MSPLPRKVERAVQSAVGRISELARGAVLPRAANGPCSIVPLIGLHFPSAVRAGAIRLKPGVAEFTERGVRFTDGSEEPFDAVILATGFRAALGPLGDLVRVDDCGFAARRDRVVALRISRACTSSATTTTRAAACATSRRTHGLSPG